MRDAFDGDPRRDFCQARAFRMSARCNENRRDQRTDDVANEVCHGSPPCNAPEDGRSLERSSLFFVPLPSIAASDSANRFIALSMAA